MCFLVSGGTSIMICGRADGEVSLENSIEQS